MGNELISINKSLITTRQLKGTLVFAFFKLYVDGMERSSDLYAAQHIARLIKNNELSRRSKKDKKLIKKLSNLVNGYMCGINTRCMQLQEFKDFMIQQKILNGKGPEPSFFISEEKEVIEVYDVCSLDVTYVMIKESLASYIFQKGWHKLKKWETYRDHWGDKERREVYGSAKSVYGVLKLAIEQQNKEGLDFEGYVDDWAGQMLDLMKKGNLEEGLKKVVKIGE